MTKQRNISLVGVITICIMGIISLAPNLAGATDTSGPPTPIDFAVPIQDLITQGRNLFESGDLIGRLGQTIQTIGRDQVIPFIKTRGVPAVFTAVQDVATRVREFDFVGLVRSIVDRVSVLFH